MSDIERRPAALTAVRPAEEVVADWPPLTAEQRTLIAALLRPVAQQARTQTAVQAA